jgi:hypothetical protein
MVYHCVLKSVHDAARLDITLLKSNVQGHFVVEKTRVIPESRLNSLNPTGPFRRLYARYKT